MIYFTQSLLKYLRNTIWQNTLRKRFKQYIFKLNDFIFKDHIYITIRLLYVMMYIGLLFKVNFMYFEK